MSLAEFSPDCPGPLDKPARPATSAPPGSCDSHFHIFGPYDRFPLSAERPYTPPEASVERYRSVMRALGLERCVLVQPSVYGVDNRAILAAANALGAPASCRMVAVIDESVDRNALDAMDRAGVRGVRFNLVAGGGPELERIGPIARRVAEFGWHIQIYVSGDILADAADALATLPVDIVIDHFGAPDPSRGLEQPGFLALLRLLETGRTWVKLSGGYIASRLDDGWSDMAPFARAFAKVRPDRLVWGTNWPHPIRYRPMPDDAALLDALRSWVPETLSAVLVTNPAKLYGFDE